MCSLLVRDRGLLSAVDFHQDEVGGVVAVLQDVEAGDARLLRLAVYAKNALCYSSVTL